jgi:tRNA(Ile)-lysidine synthase
MFDEPGTTVMCAVSGGPDSMCMMHALHELRRPFGIELEVFHFDHRLREASADDAAYVERAAASLDLPFHMRAAADEPAKGESVEDWAHRARLQALSLAMRDVGASRGAIAHTEDDQAETVLIAMIRGGGLDAVSGIKPTDGPYVRPLIDVRREEVEAFCRALHLRPRRDPSNDDTRLLRNAIRHNVLPALDNVTGRDVTPALARTASLLGEDAAELTRQATEAVSELMEETPDGLAIPASELVTLPRAIGSRVVRSALYRLEVLPEAVHVDAVLDLAEGRPGRKASLSGGLRAERDKGYVRVSRPSP